MPFIFKRFVLKELILIEPIVFSDERGFFMETYKESDFCSEGINYKFVQDNHSQSVRGVLRGLHFQREPYEQGKLVRVLEGSVYDVAVDIRPTSSTFGRWVGVELSASNRLMFFIPPGFAHGFVTLSEVAQFEYKCTAIYNKTSEGGIRWDDPDLAIQWPLKDVIVSGKDKKLPYLRDIR